MDHPPMDRGTARALRRGPARRLLLAIVPPLLIAGCASLGGSKPPPSSPDPDELAEAAFAEADSTDTAPAWWDSLGEGELSPERAAWLAEHPDVRELEDAYRQIVALTARGLLDPADDLLYLLRKQTVVGAVADADSLTAAYRQSLDRRLILLAGLLAEERAVRGDYAPADSLLEDAYADIRGLVLPDTLAPVPQEARQAMLELLRLDNPQVQEWIEYFTGPGRKHFERWLVRKAAIEAAVHEILGQAGLPPELLYMSVIESGLSAQARSRVGAVGYWQFMSGTARHFSLRHDTWVDERRDLERSTRAAATYLSQLYNYFQDWALVLAAYNAGEGRIDRVVRRAGHRDFWRLPLPSETRNHIPKFIAAHRIGTDPARYGFEARPPAPLAFDTVQVEMPTELKVVARCAGVDVDTVRALNPALVRGVTPPGVDGFTVRVPAGTGEACAQRLAAVPAAERVAWTRHTVRRGDTLGGIARRYGVTVAQLRETNRLNRSSLIHPGDVLVVAQAGAASSDRRGAVTRERSGEQREGYERVSYSVQRGDTLSGIARKLGVSLDHLRQVNNLRGHSFIRPGQRLFVFRPAGGTRAG